MSPLFMVVIYGQPACLGSLGSNTFIAGDFGSGQDNIVQTDPGIAPGFEYTTIMPPFDGFYTITNNMGRWSNSFMSWVGISDNSPDPNGYMMVVNSTFSPGLFFIQEISGLCEFTTYNFSADIFNVTMNGQDNQILPDVSFLIDGATSFTTGDIAQDELWHTYGFSFTTGVGQTSVELSLRNNAPGGFGNDLALDNISFRPCGPKLEVEVQPDAVLCEDAERLTLEVSIDNPPNVVFVQWQVSTDSGVTWMDIPGADFVRHEITDLRSGDFLYRCIYGNTADNLNNEKCQIFSDTIPIEVLAKNNIITDTICDGLTYEVGTSIYSTSGTYIDSLINRIGCDSIVMLELEVINTNIQFDLAPSDPACFGDTDGMIDIANINAARPISITLNNEEIEENAFPVLVSKGMYAVTMIDRFGCTVTETVDINDPIKFEISGLEDLIGSLGESIVLNPLSSVPIDSIVWTMNPDFSCQNCPNPEVRPLNTTIYSGSFWNENGCREDVEFRIQVRKIRPVFIPNVFTPNDDGTNDLFTVFGDASIVAAIPSLKVFNRWGDVVYDGRSLQMGDLSDGWDGTFKGGKQPSGVYIYACSILFIDGETIDYQGSLSLLR